MTSPRSTSKHLRWVFLIFVFLLCSCTPEEQFLFGLLYNRANDCHGQVDELWPASSRSWAHDVVDRESGGDPTADNPTSTASGCLQLLKMHAWRFERHGYTWSDRYNARANIIAGLDLYMEAGKSPW